MNNLYQQFKEIARPFNEGLNILENSKENIILNILKEYNPKYHDGIGIIVPAETENPTKILVSHIDLVYPFQKGFSKGKDFAIVESENGEDERMYGALDNTLTNAFLIIAIKELREVGLAKDIEFLFTEGEESGMTGMRNYMINKFPSKNDPFFINLDVTNDNQPYSGSIEFDYPCLSISREINENVEDMGFTNYRFADDVSAIVGHTHKAFSYCIPTWNYCHTYESFTLVNKLQPYYNGLLYMIKDLDVSNYENDIKMLDNSIL